MTQRQNQQCLLLKCYLVDFVATIVAKMENVKMVIIFYNLVITKHVNHNAIKTKKIAYIDQDYNNVWYI